MTPEHPITPPPELVEQWWQATMPNIETSVKDQLCTQAARWGADQELEACCEWVRSSVFIDLDGHDALRAARRPKPPSLAEAALEVVTSLRAGKCVHRNGGRMNVLTAALERLQELEKGNE